MYWSFIIDASGKLKICASVSIGQNILAPRLAKFQQLYPEIELDLQLINRRIDLIEEGFDLAIRVGKLDDSALVSSACLMLSCIYMLALSI